MEALTNHMKTSPNIKKLYLINQDYSFGQSVRSEARKMLGAKRPDIQIVGDELHPLLKITDFAPYVAKIKASGADSVITGNWGQDFALLLKAAADAGLQVDWYTYYAGGTGGPTAIKQSGVNHRVFQVSEGLANIPHKASEDFEKALRAKYDFGLFYPRAVNEIRMLVAAINEAKSLDAPKIAAKLEGMKFDVFNGGDGFMRKEDHQFFQPMYISSFGRAQRQGAVRRREDRLGLAYRHQGRYRQHDAADDLQDGSSELMTDADSLRPPARAGAEGERRRLLSDCLRREERSRRVVLELLLISTPQRRAVTGCCCS